VRRLVKKAPRHLYNRVKWANQVLEEASFHHINSSDKYGLSRYYSTVPYGEDWDGDNWDEDWTYERYVRIRVSDHRANMFRHSGRDSYADFTVMIDDKATRKSIEQRARQAIQDWADYLKSAAKKAFRAELRADRLKEYPFLAEDD
jgi:hypothetical protein